MNRVRVRADMVGWLCLIIFSVKIGYTVPCPLRKLILQHTYSRQMAEPGCESRSFHCPSKYCNHSATETDTDMVEMEW